MSLTGKPRARYQLIKWDVTHICVFKLALSLQVHPHSCCLRWPLHRRPVCDGRLSGCDRFGYGNPLGCDHHLPVLWDLRQGAERSGQHGSAALLEKHQPVWHAESSHSHFCTTFVSTKQKLFRVAQSIVSLQSLFFLLFFFFGCFFIISPIAITPIPRSRPLTFVLTVCQCEVCVRYHLYLRWPQASFKDREDSNVSVLPSN